jgi:xylan 1,4-beta-xylosidase
MPKFTCNLSDAATPLTHSWEHTVGSGHAPLALRADWQAQLRRCREELGFRHVRFHALLSDQMGTLICQSGKLLYSFFNADRIMDFLLSIGMRPFVELSFMPETLASGNKTVFRYHANVTPPKSSKQWARLIKKLVSHWVERYGLAEVSRWFFEVWNEPNLKYFGTGKRQDYFKLYRYTVEAIKGVDASLKVGGPATAQNAWVPAFLTFCEKNNLAADFISTHYYPTDAFGKIGADTVAQLAHAPPHIMQKRARETRHNARGLPVYYTEWNVSSNPRDPFHDEPFAAALATNIIMGVQDLVQSYSFWTFSDIFEENYFPSLPFHGGFGLLNLYGVAKPIYRAFELLHRLGNELLPVSGKNKTVSAWAARGGAGLTVLLTNHAMPRHAIKSELVHVQLKDATRPRAVYLERVDKEHANPRALWRTMGEPEYLSPTEVEQLQAASCLSRQSHPFHFEKRTLQLEIDLPPHSVAALTMEFAPGVLKAN